MKNFVIIVLLFGFSFETWAELNPKFSCQSAISPKGRGYLIDVIYSPWQKTYQLNLVYRSEFGTEPITSFLTRPGYTKDLMIIQDVVTSSAFPPFGSQGPVFKPQKSQNGRIFRLVVDKVSLIGEFTYNESFYGQAPRHFRSQVKCQIMTTINQFPPLQPGPKRQ